MTNCSHALLLFLVAAPAIAQNFSARVISIRDTISVLRNGRPQRIRLNGIDCPESRQPFGTKAKQFTGDLAFGKVVSIRTVDVDRYGRLIANVILEDSRNLNHELVKAGLAWWYQRYAPRDSVLEALEFAARKAGRDCGWIRMRSHLGSGGKACGQSEFHNDAFSSARITAPSRPTKSC